MVIKFWSRPQSRTVHAGIFWENSKICWKSFQNSSESHCHWTCRFKIKFLNHDTRWRCKTYLFYSDIVMVVKLWGRVVARAKHSNILERFSSNIGECDFEEFWNDFHQILDFLKIFERIARAQPCAPQILWPSKRLNKIYTFCTVNECHSSKTLLNCQPR